MLTMIKFFTDFRVNSSDSKVRSDIIIGSNLVHQYVAGLKSYVFLDYRICKP